MTQTMPFKLLDRYLCELVLAKNGLYCTKKEIASYMQQFMFDNKKFSRQQYKNTVEQLVADGFITYESDHPYTCVILPTKKLETTFNNYYKMLGQENPFKEKKTK